jgi:hypothetical protein
MRVYCSETVEGPAFGTFVWMVEGRGDPLDSLKTH